MSLLIARDLRKSFRDPSGGVLDVLRGVDLEVEAGEMIAVVGASGAGKSTLLHVIGGLEAADGGSVMLDGFNITGARGWRLAEFRAHSLGFVFQFHHLLLDLTAVENVALPLLVARCSGREARMRATEILSRAGLAARVEHRASELSGGEQQRVAVARALVAHPQLVLADEPTGNLDAGSGDEIGELLAELARERGAGVLVATHNERLARICDRRLLLHRGRIAAMEDEGD